MKKLLTRFGMLAALVLLCATLLPTRARAETPAGTYNGLNYTIENREVTITGCDKSVTDDLVIPETIDGYPVTTISKGAFLIHGHLTHIYIPKSVTSIGPTAFPRGSDLTAIEVDSQNAKYSSDEKGVLFNKQKTTLIQAPSKLSGSYAIPDTVIKISAHAFEFCYDVTDFTIPSSVKTIEEDAFRACNMKTLTIPDSVVRTGQGAFRGCRYLKEVTIGKGLDKIEVSLFAGCPVLNKVNFSNSITYIGMDAFNGCLDLNEITIPNTVLTIAHNAFSGCEQLKKVTLPEGLEVIHSSAFWDCIQLTEINIPESLTNLGLNVFGGCTSLEKITYCGTQKQWDAISVEEGYAYIPDPLPTLQILCHEKDGDPCPICGYPDVQKHLSMKTIITVVIPVAVVVLAALILIPILIIKKKRSPKETDSSSLCSSE